MSFLPAVKREIAKRQPRDAVRLTLEYLIQRGVGHRNAIPLRTIVTHLKGNGVNITETGFQQTILSDSRSSDYFIGSGRRGYYLIDSIDDAREMRDFYDVRIRTEQQNLANLRRQAAQCGWSL